MGLGTSIVLIVTGAILTFALNDSITNNDVVDLDVVGVIMMLGGLVGMIFFAVLYFRDDDAARAQGAREQYQRDQYARDQRDPNQY